MSAGFAAVSLVGLDHARLGAFVQGRSKAVQRFLSLWLVAIMDRSRETTVGRDDAALLALVDLGAGDSLAHPFGSALDVRHKIPLVMAYVPLWEEKPCNNSRGRYQVNPFFVVYLGEGKGTLEYWGGLRYPACLNKREDLR